MTATGVTLRAGQQCHRGLVGGPGGSTLWRPGRSGGSGQSGAAPTQASAARQGAPRPGPASPSCKSERLTPFSGPPHARAVTDVSIRRAVRSGVRFIYRRWPGAVGVCLLARQSSFRSSFCSVSRAAGGGRGHLGEPCQMPRHAPRAARSGDSVRAETSRVAVTCRRACLRPFPQIRISFPRATITQFSGGSRPPCRHPGRERTST